jgi:hypothetical protein
MTVRVSDPAFVYDLICSLRLAAYSAAQTGRHTLEVRVPTASSTEEAQLHLGFYLANWRARHPGVVAELVDDPFSTPARESLGWKRQRTGLA